MEPIKVVSVTLLVLGIIILVVLTAMGGVVKKTLDDTIYDRLEYKMPKGDTCYRSTRARFYEEYYLWNMTNPEGFLQGQQPNFNLVGPFSYTPWSCNFNHSLNKEKTQVQYRTAHEGYRFILQDSVGPDDVKITNLNPGYFGVVAQVGGDDGLIPLLAANSAFNETITSMQTDDFKTLVSFRFVAQVLGATTAKHVADQSPASAAPELLNEIADSTKLFDVAFTSAHFESFAHFVNKSNSTFPVTTDATTQANIFNDLTDATKLAEISVLNGSALATRYNVPAAEGSFLADYIDALLANAFVREQATNFVYTQWANNPTAYNTASNYALAKFAQGPTGLTPATVRGLLDVSERCSFTNFPRGTLRWLAILQIAQMNSTMGYSTYAQICNDDPTNPALIPLQFGAVAGWVQSYLPEAVATSFSQYGIPLTPNPWEDLAYAQWGGLILGESIKNFVPDSRSLPNFEPRFSYAPEAGDKYKFTLAQTKELLNGPKGLLNGANLRDFLMSAQAFKESGAQDTTIFTLWPMFAAGAPVSVIAFVQQYIQGVVGPMMTLPVLRQTFFNLDAQYPSGLVVTRTAREWLMTAVDPFVFQQTNNITQSQVAVVGNLTRTREEAENFPFTVYNIYNGKNDLYDSLMPWNNGTNITSWNGTMPVTGFNGTQFLPNGYLDKPSDWKKHPFVLYHRSIGRTIPFQVVGKDKWEDVNVRYLTMTADALATPDVNPVNYLYWQKYSGTVDKSRFPGGLPVYLTTPNFLSTDASFRENITFTDKDCTNLTNPAYDPSDKYSRHRYSLFLLAEPKLGSTLWGNLPIQANFRFHKTALYPNITSGFAPIFWNAIGDKASQKNLDDIKDSLYAGETAWKALIGVGVGVGVPMLIGGIIGLVIYRKQKGVKVDA